MMIRSYVLRFAATAVSNSRSTRPSTSRYVPSRLADAFLRTAHRSSRPAFQPKTNWRSLFQSATQQTRAYGRGFNYQRFQQNRAFLRRWAEGPYFYYQIAGIATVTGAFYVINLEDVPISHRRRFRIVSYKMEAQLGQDMYQQVLEEYSNRILPPTHPYYKMVQRVANRLIPYSGLPDEKWELNVIEDPQKNAFVVPGGKIFVFTGMFDVCKTDDSLAAVIGHEIGHNVAHHSAERASSGVLVMAASVILSVIVGADLGQSMLLDLIFMKPGSRTQESEADYIGLLMMSEACYDPHAAMEMWATMEKLDQGSPPQWLSTHPSNHNRLEKIRKWLPQAEQKLQDSNCQMIRPQADEFWTKAMAYR